MRIIAAIYLTIVLVNFGFWFTSRSEQDFFPTPYAYMVWALYFFSILALLAYVVGKRFLPRKVWVGVFAIYITVRLLELINTGIALEGDSLLADLNAIANYLWLVLPAALAMAYLGFSNAGEREAAEQISMDCQQAEP